MAAPGLCANVWAIQRALPLDSQDQDSSPIRLGGESNSLDELALKPNQSFLGSSLPQESEQQQLFSAPMISAVRAGEFKMRWMDTTRDYDRRQQYGQNTLADRQQHLVAMRSLSEDLFGEVSRNQISARNQDINEALERDPYLNSLKNPVGIAAAAVAVYNGKPVKIRLSRETVVMTRAQFKKQQGEFQLKSNWVDGIALFQGRNPSDSRSESGSNLVDPSQERLRTGLSRTFGKSGFRSGFLYGVYSKQIQANASQQLTDQVSVALDSTRVISNPTAANGQETVRVLYGIQF